MERTDREAVLEFADAWLPLMERRLLEPLEEGHYAWVLYPGLKEMRDELLALKTRLSQPDVTGEQVP